MRAVVQRVKNASVTINNCETRSIENGILILLGIKETDTMQLCEKMADKCANLRIFDDENGNLNISAAQLSYEALVISNFTLYGDTKKGKRPSFITAAKPPLSINLYENFIAELNKTNLKSIVTGEFGADMQVSLINDGPVTIILDTDEWAKKQV